MANVKMVLNGGDARNETIVDDETAREIIAGLLGVDVLDLVEDDGGPMGYQVEDGIYRVYCYRTDDERKAARGTDGAYTPGWTTSDAYDAE